MTILYVAIGLFVLLALWAIAVHNSLVRLVNQVRNAFSQIDVQLQRRYDLIPNLVETAKGYMKHERETLEAVINARNQAMSAAQRVKNAPCAEAMRDFQGAENALGGVLTRFMALREAYPDLKANQNMISLQEELSSTENRIAFARQGYNDQVTSYNTRLQMFPASVVASMLGHRAETLWVSDDGPAIRSNVRVSF